MSKVKSILIGAVVGAAMFMSSYAAKAEAIDPEMRRTFCIEFSQLVGYTVAMRDEGKPLSYVIGLALEDTDLNDPTQTMLFNLIKTSSRIVYDAPQITRSEAETKFLKSCLTGLKQ